MAKARKSRKEVPIEETRLVKLLKATGCTMKDWEEVHKIVTGKK